MPALAAGIFWLFGIAKRKENYGDKKEQVTKSLPVQTLLVKATIIPYLYYFSNSNTPFFMRIANL